MNSTAARPVEPFTHTAPRSLPAWVYDHPEMTRLEYERILKPSWQIACHVSQIRAAGDYVTFELGSDSVIVLREASGARARELPGTRSARAQSRDGAGRSGARVRVGMSRRKSAPAALRGVGTGPR